LGLKVLSLFDGMSCGQLALQRLGIEVDTYFASEIDKYAIQVTQANFPKTIQVGDVCELKAEDYQDIDLILAGSPCQGFSFAGKQLAFDDPRSALFFEFIRLLKEIKPKYFLLENVKMKQQFQDVITEQVSACYPDFEGGDLFGSQIKPILINSALLSAQNRQRLYWTNIPNIEQPEDKGIVLRDILEDDVEDHYLAGKHLQNNYQGGNQLNPNYKSQANTIHDTEKKSGVICAGTHGYANGYVISAAWRGRYKEDGTTEQKLKLNQSGKSNSLTTVQKDSVVVKDVIEEERIVVDKEKRQLLIAEATKKGYTVIEDGDCFDINFPNSKTRRGRNMKYKCNALTTASQNFMRFENLSWRKLTPLECERLQTVPDNYTNHVSNTQRYKMLGNGWTVEVIAHILNNMKL
jgi:DNA-cytosine methyltransferase